MENQLLFKNTMADMRALSAAEITALTNGTYSGVQLLGYYQIGDTPDPINYYVSLTTDLDDGGSIISVGGLKLEHLFASKVNSIYFGIKPGEDYTQKINDFLVKVSNRGWAAEFSGGDYFVDATFNLNKGISIPSNSKIITSSKTRFITIPNSSGNYRCFSIINAENIEINRLVCIGDREDHIGNSGEWGIGLGILSSSNVSIGYLECNNFFGDGLYIGKFAVGTSSSSNIKIDTLKADNNMRQGLSIITVDGLYIDTAIVSNTNGLAPQAGVDIEPNHNTDILRNIYINNLCTDGNIGNGLIVIPTKLDDSSNFVDINIGSINSRKETAFSLQGSLPKRIQGVINIGSIISEKATGSAVYFRNTYNNLDCFIKKVVSIDANQNNLPTNFGSSIRIASDTGDTYFLDRIASKIRIADIDVVSNDNKIDRPILVAEFNRLSAEPSIDFDFGTLQYRGGRQEPAIISKSSRGIITNVIDVPNGITLVRSVRTPGQLSNKGATDASYITLNPYFSGYQLTLKVVEPYNFGIQNQNNFRICGYEDVTSANLISNRIGDRVTIEYIQDNTWAIVEVVGKWTMMDISGNSYTFGPPVLI